MCTYIYWRTHLLKQPCCLPFMWTYQAHNLFYIIVPISGLVCSVPAMVPVADPNCSSTANSDARKRQKTHHHHQQPPSPDSHGGDSCGAESAAAEVNVHHSTSTDIDMGDSSHPINKDTENCTSRLSDKTENTTERSLKGNLQDVLEECSTASMSAGAERWIKIMDDELVTSTSSVEVYQHGCPATPRTQSLPELTPIPGTEFRWLQLPKRPFRQGASPAEVTAAGMDSSYLLEWLIKKSERLVVGGPNVFCLIICWRVIY